VSRLHDERERAGKEMREGWQLKERGPTTFGTPKKASGIRGSYKNPPDWGSLALPFLSPPTMPAQTNASELNKLKKGELVELSIKHQDERSKLTELIATLQNNEAGLQDRVMGLQDDKSELEGAVADLTGQKELLERKYGKSFPAGARWLKYSQSVISEGEAAPPCQ
jgi:hypothetical protein